MGNQKKKTNTKKSSKYVIPSNEEIEQSIKDSVKSKVTQKRATSTTTTTKPADKHTTEKTTPPADTSKAKKSSVWDKTPKSVKWVSKNIVKGGVPAISNLALDNMNETSSLYYDPNTGMYVDSADMQAIWQKNLANNNWRYDIPYSVFNKLPNALGEGISDVLRVKDPTTRKIVSGLTNAASYVIPYYGIGKSIYDTADKVSNTIWDTNRDMDMLKDLRYGNLGYSNKWLLDNDDDSWLSAPATFAESIWEGIKTASANDWVHNLTGLDRRTGFSEQSDIYKLGQQTTVKMMQKMLEDTNNFDPANANSRATLDKFNMMNTLLKNSDRYWELQSIKKDKNMSDESFYNYLNNAGIDTNTYRGMEYAAKQLYNLGDNQERNGLRYDNSIISTQAPMLQYKYARKQKPIADDPLANLVGGNHILDGFHKVGDKFINTKPKKESELVAEVKEEKKDNAPQKEVLNNSVDTDSATITENPYSDLTPEYLTNFYKEFDKKYDYDPAKGRFNIWL